MASMDALAALQSEIDATKAEIMAVEEKIQAAASPDDPTKHEVVKFLWKEKQQLRKKVGQLRKKEEQLREEKLILLRQQRAPDLPGRGPSVPFSGITVQKFGKMLDQLHLVLVHESASSNAAAGSVTHETAFTAFAWPEGRSEAQCTPQLLLHMEAELERAGVTIGESGFMVRDVHAGQLKLHLTAGNWNGTGVPDGIVVPASIHPLSYGTQLRAVVDIKQPVKDRAAFADAAKRQAALELIASHSTSEHPVVVLLTDGGDCNCMMRMFDKVSVGGGCGESVVPMGPSGLVAIAVSDQLSWGVAMSRLAAHLKGSSADPLFCFDAAEAAGRLPPAVAADGGRPYKRLRTAVKQPTLMDEQLEAAEALAAGSDGVAHVRDGVAHVRRDFVRSWLLAALANPDRDGGSGDDAEPPRPAVDTSS